MRYAFLYIIALCVLCPPKASSEPYLIPGSDFQDSGWVGMGFANSETGEFNHCTITTIYDNEQMLSFSITPWPSFAIYFPMYQGGNTVGSQFPISIWIDDLEPIRGLARKVEENSAFLGMPLEQEIVDVFQSGWLMTIEVEGGWRQTYKLRGTRNAITGLKLCAANYWSYSEKNPPNFVPDEDRTLAEQPSPDEEFRGATGSGFYVNAKGNVLTNAHVVEGCGAIKVDGTPAKLIATSEEFDLAILHVADPSTQDHAIFASDPAPLNTQITVGGYPYSGFLGDINVTQGSLTSLKGLGGDGITIQISAPIQPGNSGGPVINSKGDVVGVVVSTLDAQKILKDSGSIPQNINFAINGDIAQLFMRQNRVPFAIGDDSPETLSDEILGEELVSYTTLITCEP